MRRWRSWRETLILSTQYNPPQFVEVVMLLLGILLLFIWTVTGQWPYLVLSLSYVVGSSTAMLVRETLFPSSRLKLTQTMAVLLLLMSSYTLVDVISSYLY